VNLEYTLTREVDGGNMKSFRYYRYASPAETAKENQKKVLDVLKKVCFLIAFAFLLTAVLFLLR